MAISRFIIVCVILLSHQAFAGVLKFENRHKEFGKVARGQILEHTFKFKNSGKTPIKIMGVSTDCGCTIVRDFHSQTFEPGDKSELKVQLDTKDFDGRVKREISIITDAKGQKSYNLYVRAQVDSEFKVDPVLVDFGSINLDIVKPVEVKVRRAKGHKASVTGLTLSSELITGQLSKDGDAWKVMVSVSDDAPPGFLKEFVLLQTNSFFLPKLKIPVRANIDGGLVHKPSYIEFGAIEKGKSSIRKVVFDKAPVNLGMKVKSFLINGVEGNPENYHVSISGITKAKDTSEVKVSLENTKGVTGNVHGIMLFQSDTDKETTASVEFYGLFR